MIDRTLADFVASALIWVNVILAGLLALLSLRQYIHLDVLYPRRRPIHLIHCGLGVYWVFIYFWIGLVDGGYLPRPHSLFCGTRGNG